MDLPVLASTCSQIVPSDTYGGPEFKISYSKVSLALYFIPQTIVHLMF